jgi:hypothetical protein
MFQKGSKVGSKRVENIGVENLTTEVSGRDKNHGGLSRQSRKDDLQKKLSNADLSENKNSLSKKGQASYPKYLRQYSQHYSRGSQRISSFLDHSNLVDIIIKDCNMKSRE